MSTGSVEPPSGDAHHSRAEVFGFSVAFIALLYAALIWPEPVLWVNRAFFEVPISVNEVSFLGREAPSWDVVYWGLVGIAVLALLHGRLERFGETWPQYLDDVRELRRLLARRLRRPKAGSIAATVAVGALLVAACYWFADAPLIARITNVRAGWVHDAVRLSNRLGGGGNPPMIILFFVLAGLTLRRLDWARLGTAMAVAALVAGTMSAVIKRIVERARPDVWYGPRLFGWEGETSFPSGHTIGAFAMAVVIATGARSRTFRAVALLLACSIGCSRVLTLRHWPSDVVASALLGSAVGMFAGGATWRAKRHEENEG